MKYPTTIEEAKALGREYLHSVSFYGHRDNGTVGKNCLSQFFICNFTDGINTFHSAEQYMMFHKALLFEDYEIANKILSVESPSKCKELGREVRNFYQLAWDAEKIKIVFTGNNLKFTQNKDCFDYLYNNEGTLFIEAAPYDTIWGIGQSHDKTDPDDWKGLNLLGFVLTHLRKTLKIID